MSYDEEDGSLEDGDVLDEELLDPLEEPLEFDTGYEDEDPDKDH